MDNQARKAKSDIDIAEIFPGKYSGNKFIVKTTKKTHKYFCIKYSKFSLTTADFFVIIIIISAENVHLQENSAHCFI